MVHNVTIILNAFVSSSFHVIFDIFWQFKTFLRGKFFIDFFFIKKQSFLCTLASLNVLIDNELIRFKFMEIIACDQTHFSENCCCQIFWFVNKSQGRVIYFFVLNTMSSITEMGFNWKKRGKIRQNMKFWWNFRLKIFFLRFITTPITFFLTPLRHFLICHFKDKEPFYKDFIILRVGISCN